MHFAAAGRPAQAQGERRARVPAADPAVRRCAAGPCGALRHWWAWGVLDGHGLVRQRRRGLGSRWWSWGERRRRWRSLGRRHGGVIVGRLGRAPRDRAGWTPGRRARMLLP